MGHRRLERAAPALWAAAAGVVLAIALPGPGLSPFVLLFPGLLLASIAAAPGWRSAALAGLIGGTVHWLVTVHWVLPVMHNYGRLPLVAAIACLVVMAALLGLSWGLVAGVVRLVSPPLRVVLLPFAWIAVEAWRQIPPYVFPWNPTAAALASAPVLLASAPVWGATGIGWAATALGAGLAGTLHRGTRRVGIATAVAAVALTLVFSTVAPAPRPMGPAVKVAVIQPGTGLEVKWDPERWQEMVAGVWRLTREAAAEGATLVLWPESAVPFSLERDPSFRDTVVDLARELDVTIVLTSIGGTPEGGATNSAYTVSPAGVSPVRYDKVRLVPFGEYVPLVAHFAFTRALVREVGQFTPGRGPVLLPAGVPLGMSICYEIVFADLVAAQVRIGATVLATLTNDAWYGFSSAPHQHFEQAVLRAAEARRPLVRAALTGISGFVDPYGRVTAELGVGRSGLLVEPVQPCSGLTPRVRWGDWWGVLSAVAAMALVALSRRRRHRTERTTKTQRHQAIANLESNLAGPGGCFQPPLLCGHQTLTGTGKPLSSDIIFRPAR